MSQYPYPIIVHHDHLGMPNIIELCMRVLDLGQLCRGVIHRTIQGPYCSKCGNPHTGVLYSKMSHPQTAQWTEKTGWKLRDQYLTVQTVPLPFNPVDRIAALLGPNSSFGDYASWKDEHDQAEEFLDDLCLDEEVDVNEFTFWKHASDAMLRHAIRYFKKP